MKRKLFLSLLLLVIAGALLGVVSVSALAAGYSLDWWTVGGGGATSSTGGSYNLGGSIGQPDAGSLNGGSYSLNGGFWPGAVTNYKVFLPLVLKG